MADAVTSEVLFNGRRHLVYRFTNSSDGTGESAVTKVDATSATNGIFLYGQTILPGVHLKVTKVIYDINGMALRIQWDATTDQDMLVLDGFGTLDFRDIGGIQNPGAAVLAGSTGSINFSTGNAGLGSSYSVVLHMTKGI